MSEYRTQTSEDDSHDEYLTTADVAKKLRRHPRTIRDWIVKGRQCPTAWCRRSRAEPPA